MFKSAGWFAVLVVFSVFATGCSGGGGGGSAAPGNQTPGAAGSTAASDYSAMLVGHWRQQGSSGEWTDMWFHADGTCSWINTSYDGESTYDAWLWSVSGGNELPEVEAPWILQLRAGPNSTAPYLNYMEAYDLEGKTTVIVAIDDVGFTEYWESEGDPRYTEWTRVP